MQDNNLLHATHRRRRSLSTHIPRSGHDTPITSYQLPHPPVSSERIPLIVQSYSSTQHRIVSNCTRTRDLPQTHLRTQVSGHPFLVWFDYSTAFPDMSLASPFPAPLIPICSPHVSPHGCSTAMYLYTVVYTGCTLELAWFFAHPDRCLNS